MARRALAQAADLEALRRRVADDDRIAVTPVRERPLASDPALAAIGSDASKPRCQRTVRSRDPREGGTGSETWWSPSLSPAGVHGAPVCAYPSARSSNPSSTKGATFVTSSTSRDVTHPLCRQRTDHASFPTAPGANRVRWEDRENGI